MAGQTDYGKCRSCGADVAWSTTASGARMPLQPRWLTVFVDRGDGQVKAIRGRESHWAHCPHADRHRRDKSEGAQ